MLSRERFDHRLPLVAFFLLPTRFFFFCESQNHRRKKEKPTLCYPFLWCYPGCCAHFCPVVRVQHYRVQQPVGEMDSPNLLGEKLLSKYYTRLEIFQSSTSIGRPGCSVGNTCNLLTFRREFECQCNNTIGGFSSHCA